MAVKHVILGRLMDGPSYGYELRKAPLQPLHGDFGTVEAHIYAALRALKKEGLVRLKRVRQGRFPQQLRYSITSPGRVVFRAWLKGGQDEALPAPFSSAVADPLVLKVEFFWRLKAKERRSKIRGQQELSRRRVAGYVSALKSLPNSRPIRWRAAPLLEAGLAYEKARMGWLRKVERRVVRR